jgi:3-oxoacyl-[acyl-carrier-protein] synthase-1
MRMSLKPVQARVDYINPHATSTPIGDLKEMEAIREVFGRDTPPIAATKSLTGHSLGAAGAQEAIYSLLMMNNGFICESANIATLDPAFADMPIVRERRDGVTLGCVLSNSFGFGGTNASVVFKRLDAYGIFRKSGFRFSARKCDNVEMSCLFWRGGRATITSGVLVCRR